MGLPPIGQPSEENCYDCFYVCKTTVMIKVGLGLESVVGLGLVFGFVLRSGLVSGLHKWLFYRANVKPRTHFDIKTYPLPLISNLTLLQRSSQCLRPTRSVARCLTCTVTATRTMSTSHGPALATIAILAARTTMRYQAAAGPATVSAVFLCLIFHALSFPSDVSLCLPPTRHV